MQDLNEIFKDFSHSRLLTYKNFLKLRLQYDNYTPEQVYHLYVWNEEIASSFWLLLSRIEITLRNRINDIFVEKFGKYWLDLYQYHNTKIVFSEYHKGQIDKSEQKLKQKGVPPNNDRMVAELNMGFWVIFNGIGFDFDKSYLKDNEIGWVYFLPRIFSGYVYKGDKPDKFRHWSNPSNVDKIAIKLNVAKELRNRIAHHEPIFNYIPSHLSHLPKEKLDNFLKTLQSTYGYLLQLLQDLSPQQARIYQKSYTHHRAIYLLSDKFFNELLCSSSLDDVMSSEQFIEYLMDCMDKE